MAEPFFNHPTILYQVSTSPKPLLSGYFQFNQTYTFSTGLPWPLMVLVSVSFQDSCKPAALMMPTALLVRKKAYKLYPTANLRYKLGILWATCLCTNWNPLIFLLNDAVFLLIPDHSLRPEEKKAQNLNVKYHRNCLSRVLMLPPSFLEIYKPDFHFFFIPSILKLRVPGKDHYPLSI